MLRKESEAVPEGNDPISPRCRQNGHMGRNYEE